MAEQTKIARNTILLTLASIIQKIISFAYYFYLSKKIGVDNLGNYTFALSISSIFVIFMDFGLGPILTREGARFKENLQYYFENIFSLKLILTAISLVLMYITINILNALSQNVGSTDTYLVYLAGLVIILDTFTFTFYSVFRALKRLEFEALGIVVYQAIIFICGFIFIKINAPLFCFILALVAGSLFNFIYFLILIKRKAGLSFRLVFPWDTFKKFLFLCSRLFFL